MYSGRSLHKTHRRQQVPQHAADIDGNPSECPPMKTLSPTCPKCQGADFQLRTLSDEGVAAARCVRCSADHLLLDSEDYWFDVIQQGYPRLTRCSCKSESFRLRIDYGIRDDGEIAHIDVHSICSACGKARRRLDFDVDYGGTGHLIEKPLVPCKNPKVLYDLNNLHLLLSPPGIVRVIDHLAQATCEFLSLVRKGDAWAPVRQDAAEAKATIESGRYLFVYAMPNALGVPGDQIDTIKKESAFWKRSEVIRIGSRSHVCTYRTGDDPPSLCYRSDRPTHGSYTEIGLSFQLDFSNEFVRGDHVVAKSEGFRQVTTSLLAMLAITFVSWRGPHCFDDPDVNLLAFGDRFQKKLKARTKR